MEENGAWINVSLNIHILAIQQFRIVLLLLLKQRYLQMQKNASCTLAAIMIPLAQH